MVLVVEAECCFTVVPVLALPAVLPSSVTQEILVVFFVYLFWIFFREKELVQKKMKLIYMDMD